MYKRILLFGGTFNPIHNGHLIIAQQALEQFDFKKVIFIPSFIPPLKENFLSFFHRLKMTELAVDNIDYFEISNIEEKRDGLSYTIDTVRYFKKKLGKETIVYWLMGTDTVKELKKWHKIKELLEECRFIVAGRNNYRKNLLLLWQKELKNIKTEYNPLLSLVPLTNPIIQISSTLIRNKLYSNKKQSIKFLVPEKVEQYIYENELYKNNR